MWQPCQFSWPKPTVSQIYDDNSDRFLLRPIGNGLNNVYLQLHPQLPLLCPPLLNFNHLEWSTIQKLQSYNSSTTRPNYSLGKPSNDRFKIQLTPGADRPSLFILRLPEIGGWLWIQLAKLNDAMDLSNFCPQKYSMNCIIVLYETLPRPKADQSHDRQYDRTLLFQVGVRTQNALFCQFWLFCCEFAHFLVYFFQA